MLTKPFLKAKPILETIESHQHKAYFVGGCVRDYLLDRPLGDIDITTSASPEMIQGMFDKVIPVGIEHGTVIVVHNDESYEVTTFRIDGDYTDKRHPDSVEFIDNVDKDLERRDFTINALAMDVNGEIIDLFEGSKDLKNKLIRTVGNGYERFTEDPLRIIRAIRFSSQLGFSIHEGTLQDMIKVNKDIKTLAVERITKEFTKLFAGVDVQKALFYLKSTETYKFLPIFNDHPKLIDLFPDNLQPLHSFGEVIALLHLLDSGISVESWSKTWKCSNKIKQEATEIVSAYNYIECNQLDMWVIYQLNPKYYNGFIRVFNNLKPQTIDKNEVNQIHNSLPIQTKKDLDIKGNELKQLFPDKSPGPWINQLIRTIEKNVVSGRINNTNQEIKEWAKWNPPEIN